MSGMLSEYNFKAIRPITIDSSILSSTNATDATAEYASATTYADGDQVKVTTTSGGAATATFKIYESQVGSNQGNDPTTDSGTNWVEVSSTNPYKMFDNIPQDQTQVSGGIDVTITPGEGVNSLALINLTAETVDITVTSLSGGGTVYSETINLSDTTKISSWYEFFFEDALYYSNDVKLDIPYFSDCVITVNINGTGTVGCGALIIGKQATLGWTQHGSDFGYVDYSAIDIDADGRFSITTGDFSKRQTLRVDLLVDHWNGIEKALFALRNTPAVWVAEESYKSAIIFGFLREFDIKLSNPALARAEIDLIGLLSS